jgi:DNA mismatch repair protein MutL
MSSKIKLLPENLANQIAAGEVVERPASVVKELVENSLDAGGASVTIEVEQGGKRMIRVTDDGEGMSRNDALLCLERHATSKLEKSEGLFAIRSLGFRGEALPSIGSVSDMRIVTRNAASDAGVVVNVYGGTIKSVDEVGAPKGTEVTARRLFFNVPARRKFLKTVNTEMGHINHYVSNMALARPDVHFKLIHNERTVFDLPASPDLSARLRHAIGADAAANLVPVNFDDYGDYRPGRLRISGYVSVPSYTRSSTRGLHLFVNRRFVRDRLISHAVFECYRSLIPKGRYPLVAIFVDLPPEVVDVNVHPAKHEVRFQDQAFVHDSVRTAIRNALKVGDRIGSPPPVKDSERRHFELAPAPQEVRLPFDESRSNETQIGISERELETQEGVTRALQEYQQRAERKAEAGSIDSYSNKGGRSLIPPDDAGEPEPSLREDQPKKDDKVRAIHFSNLRVIGQTGEAYLIAEDEDALYLIDQHAAHERIAFERLRDQFEAEEVVRQALLFPVTLELTYQEARKVETMAERLSGLGFEVEPFGGNTVALKAIPAMLSGADPASLLLEVVDTIGELGGIKALDERLDDIFAVMACHSVIRSGQAMSGEEIKALLGAMDRAQFPGHCPHGRDVVVRIPFHDLGKWFGR